MKKTTKKLYDVQCGICKEVFPVVLEIVDGTDKKKTTEVEVYCPNCHEMVSVTIPGETKPDIIIKKKSD